MDRPQQLTALQVDLAHLFFTLDAAEGYLVAGGTALLASDLITRPTEDLDLFTAAPTIAVTPARNAFVEALRERSCEVTTVQDGPTFCRMIISREGEETLVDLAIDSSPHNQPILTVLGPTLAPLELAGRKLLALFDRAAARDFADVYVLAQRFGKAALIGQAQKVDAGFELAVLAQMLGTLDRFDDEEIPLDPKELRLAREFFRGWADELA